MGFACDFCTIMVSGRIHLFYHCEADMTDAPETEIEQLRARIAELEQQMQR